MCQRVKFSVVFIAATVTRYEARFIGDRLFSSSEERRQRRRIRFETVTDDK